MMQPFGSAQGDFYLRFYKAPLEKRGKVLSTIDEVRFENIVVETAKKIIAERGEPTTYSIILNGIDPVLASNVYFS